MWQILNTIVLVGFSYTKLVRWSSSSWSSFVSIYPKYRKPGRRQTLPSSESTSVSIGTSDVGGCGTIRLYTCLCVSLQQYHKSDRPLLPKKTSRSFFPKKTLGTFFWSLLGRPQSFQTWPLCFSPTPSTLLPYKPRFIRYNKQTN
jgi:hypothetical protein